MAPSSWVLGFEGADGSFSGTLERAYLCFFLNPLVLFISFLLRFMLYTCNGGEAASIQTCNEHLHSRGINANVILLPF